MLLGGDHPFFEEGDGQRELYQKITGAKFEFNDDSWQQVSSEAKDLIKRLLTYDPNQRITAEEALMRHPWISKPSYELVAVNLSRSISLLKNYKTISLLRGNSAMAVADIAIDVMRKLSQTSVGKGKIIKYNRLFSIYSRLRLNIFAPNKQFDPVCSSIYIMT